MYDHILVPTDGSDHAMRATDHAAVVARAFDATVHLLNVVDLNAAAGPFSAGGVGESYVEQLTEASEAELDRIAASVADDVSVETAVVTGHPAAGIVSYVEDHDIDLVSMGTHGRSGLRRYLTGSVAERVVRLSPVPVVTVRATEASEVAGGYDDIMVPTDGSDCAQAAVAHALALAERFDSRVHAVGVVDVSVVSTGSEMGVPSGLLDELEAAATEHTRAVERDAEAAGVEHVGAVHTGRVRQTLLAYADERDIDLVCMGTHGRTGLERFLLGSTAESLVRQADAPVMTVSVGRD